MNAVMQETPQVAARRLSARMLQSGYQPTGLHQYCDADGEPVFWRIRCKHPLGEKWMRPMQFTGTDYVLGEPLAPAAGKWLYRLPEITSSTGTVYVVEGEACADALFRAGKIATTSGGADSANAADWTPLRGRHVIVWPDNDGAGRKYGDAVTAKLRGLGCTVESVDVAALHLPDKGDCVDWLQEHAADELGALPRCDTCDSATLAGTESQNRGNRSAPEPLRRPTPPAEPYPLAELGAVLQPAAEAIKRVIQAPDAIIGGSLLAAASLAAQAQADVHIDGRTIPLSLWLLSVAESGERKSAVDAEAMRAARVYEAELGKGYEAALEIHAAELAQWEAQRDAAKAEAKKTKGVGLADALRKLGPPPPAPLLPRVTAADFTAEGLFKLLSASRPTVGAFTDEAALVFGGHGMTKETVMRTAGTLCKLWDNGTLDRVRSGDGAQKLHGRRFALHLLAQPVIAERALSDDVLAGQGFLARCLLAWPQGTAGGRAYLAESLRNDTAMQRLASVLLALHRKPLPLAEGERQALTPRALVLEPDAKAAWIALHDAVESHCGPGQRFAQVKPWASKAAEQALRIAGVLALVDNPDATGIGKATMERAGELALWHLNEAVRLAGTAELSPEVRDAEALLDWCHATGRSVIYSREVLNKGPNRIREREAFEHAIGELVHTGWAEPLEGGMPLDGAHRRHVWRIVPASEGR